LVFVASPLSTQHYSIHHSIVPVIMDTSHQGLSRFDLQLPVQSVPIITKVVSSNPAHGEV
jgi:hypothetical protein